MSDRLIRKKLSDWYARGQRDLPWRKTDDPYCIWVSEVMLQQTRVATVIPYYERFIRCFPDIRALAEADVQEVLKHWEGLGYYARARNLCKAAGMLMNEYGGVIPREHKNFIRLPGVGDYIAAAVLSIAFGQPHAVVDGNVKRVLARLFLMEETVNHSGNHKTFKRRADALLDTRCPSEHNQALMELGAMICTPRNPVCGDCPLSSHCRALQRGKTEEFPKRKKTGKIPTFPIAAGVLVRAGKILIVRRPDTGLLGGLWEFPGGKVKAGERASDACIREIYEKTAVQAKNESFLLRVKHAYSHFKIEMDVFLCSYVSGNVQLNGPVDYRWVGKEGIRDYPFSSSDLKVISAL